MPLQYLAYFPAAVFLGKVTGRGADPRPVDRVGLGGGASVIAARVVFHFGVRHYSGYGG